MNNFTYITPEELLKGPKHYRLRHTLNGGLELLGGYECSKYVDGKLQGMSIEWRVMPTLPPNELPED